MNTAVIANMLGSNPGKPTVIQTTRMMVCIGSRALVEYSVGRDFTKRGSHHEVRRPGGFSIV